MSWRVRPDDVLIEMGGMFGSKGGLQRLDVENISLQQFGIHSGRASIASFTSLPPQVYTTIGQFKGERVAIKKVNVKKVDLTPQLLWEIKQARDVSHENTVRFVGACIDLPRPTVLILTEYCSRGSLKDVLENEAIELDWNFRMSLIHDIVKGMNYLHNSDVAAHGKLRSCNCLIDGRFVLKISDFGLRTLTTPSDFVRDQNYYLSEFQRHQISFLLLSGAYYCRALVDCSRTASTDHHTWLLSSHAARRCVLLWHYSGGDC